jgi:hypothetical protein
MSDDQDYELVKHYFLETLNFLMYYNTNIDNIIDQQDIQENIGQCFSNIYEDFIEPADNSDEKIHFTIAGVVLAFKAITGYDYGVPISILELSKFLFPEGFHKELKNKIIEKEKLLYRRYNGLPCIKEVHKFEGFNEEPYIEDPQILERVLSLSMRNFSKRAPRARRASRKRSRKTNRRAQLRN